jgi:hypothetical protein
MTIDELIDKLIDIKFHCGGDKQVVVNELLPPMRVGMVWVVDDDDGKFRLWNQADKSESDIRQQVLYIGRG